MTILGGGSTPTPPAGGADGALVKDATDATFMADVIETSKETPVLVDFWAPWCGPCRQLTPALERQVQAAGGKVKLVKINVDENPQAAGQLRVQSIPTVFAFVDGQPVDGFMGAVPESQIKAVIEKLSTSGGAGAAQAEQIEAALAQAGEAVEAGDLPTAMQIYGAISQADPENVPAIVGMAQCYLASGDVDKAEARLDMVPADKQEDAAVKAIKASIALAKQAGNAGDPILLAERIAANPEDHEARFELAQALVARGDLDGARDRLLEIVEKDREWNDSAARKQLLQLFDAAGADSDFARQGRRRLSAILFA